jgi:hypothetical protein
LVDGLQLIEESKLLRFLFRRLKPLGARGERLVVAFEAGLGLEA